MMVDVLIGFEFGGEPGAVGVSVGKRFSNDDSGCKQVKAPVGVARDAKRYDVNAEMAAGAIASAQRASRFLLRTDVAGVLDGKKELIREIAADDVQVLIRDGVASGGMIPKLETAAGAVKNGVGGAVILDGRAKHALLMELFTEHGAGTIVL